MLESAEFEGGGATDKAYFAEVGEGARDVGRRYDCAPPDRGVGEGLSCMMSLCCYYVCGGR